MPNPNTNGIIELKMHLYYVLYLCCIWFLNFILVNSFFSFYLWEGMMLHSLFFSSWAPWFSRILQPLPSSPHSDIHSGWGLFAIRDGWLQLICLNCCPRVRHKINICESAVGLSSFFSWHPTCVTKAALESWNISRYKNGNCKLSIFCCRAYGSLLLWQRFALSDCFIFTTMFSSDFMFI